MAKSTAKKIEIVSITYKVDGEKHTMKPAIPAKIQKSAKAKGFLAAHADSDEGTSCTVGQTRCVDGKLQRCRAIDDEGTSIWFVTSESC